MPPVVNLAGLFDPFNLLGVARCQNPTLFSDPNAQERLPKRPAWRHKRTEHGTVAKRAVGIEVETAGINRPERQPALGGIRAAVDQAADRLGKSRGRELRPARSERQLAGKSSPDDVLEMSSPSDCPAALSARLKPELMIPALDESTNRRRFMGTSLLRQSILAELLRHAVKPTAAQLVDHRENQIVAFTRAGNARAAAAGLRPSAYSAIRAGSPAAGMRTVPVPTT